MRKLLWIISWIELILGIAGFIIYACMDGLRDTNLGLMISLGFIVAAAFTYGFFFVFGLAEAMDKNKQSNSEKGK
jgi:hypothetical protein